MTKIAITGCAGFIGFHTAKKLWDQGFDVVGFDNFNDYYDPSLKFDRRKELNDYGILYIEKGDLMDPTFLSEFMHDHEPDLVLHLAAYANVRLHSKTQKNIIIIIL